MFKTLLTLFLLSALEVASAQVCVLHRAHYSGLPENSLEGIEKAVKSGVSGLEFDIQITKDGKAFIYHDTKLGEELLGSECPTGSKIHKLNSTLLRNCFLSNGRPLPTFQETLPLIKDYPGYLFLDLKKVPSKEFFKQVESIDLHKNKKLRLISFKKRALRPSKKRWPQVESILLSRYIPRGLFYNGIGFNNRLRFFSPLFRVLKKETALWTLNSEETIQEAVKKNSKFIITDEYDLCESLK